MIKCTVEYHYSALLVKFEDGKSLLIQVDYDQHQFVQDCGISCSFDSSEWMIETIEECPEEYYDVADDSPE